MQTMLLDNKIGQGKTAEIFDIGDNRVVKLFYKTIPLQWAEHEWQINRTLCQEGFPVAKVYDLMEHEGRKGIIYERIVGEPLLQRVVRNPWKVRRIGRMMAELHLQIHRKTDCDLPLIKDDLSQRILHTDLLDDDIKGLLLDFLRELPSESVLCHGDFHPDNIILSKDKVFIIDWMTATKGSSCADVARTALLLNLAELPADIPAILKVLMKFMRSQIRHAYMKRYIQLTDCSITDIQQWEAPVAAARLVERLSISERQAIIRLIERKRSYMEKITASKS